MCAYSSVILLRTLWGWNDGLLELVSALHDPRDRDFRDRREPTLALGLFHAYVRDEPGSHSDWLGREREVHNTVHVVGKGQVLLLADDGGGNPLGKRQYADGCALQVESQHLIFSW